MVCVPHLQCCPSFSGDSHLPAVCSLCGVVLRPTEQPLVTQGEEKGKTVSRKFELFLELIIAAGVFHLVRKCPAMLKGLERAALLTRLSVDMIKKRVDDNSCHNNNRVEELSCTRCGRRCQQGYKHQLYIYTFSQQVSLLEREVGHI